MCLSIVTERIDKPSTKLKTAYKIFKVVKKNRKAGFTLQFSVMLGYRLITNRWLNANTSTSIDADCIYYSKKNKMILSCYQSGFHTYGVKKEAQKNLKRTIQVLVPVQISEITAVGVQSKSKVYVSRKMYIYKKDVTAALDKWLKTKYNPDYQY